MFEVCKLKIYNDFSNIQHACALLGSVAESLNFTEKEVFRLKFALEETLTNTIENSFEEDEKAEIEIEIISVSGGIEVVIRDKGLPFNPFRKAGTENFEASLDASRQDISEHLIQNMLSSAVFNNLGKKGKEARLLLYSENYRINNLSSKDDEKVRLETEDKFQTVRLFRESDAYEVSRLFYKSYGHSYVNEIVYYPDRLLHNVKTGKMHSALAVSEQDRIIGHIALFEPGCSKDITEWGMAVSDPAYRGQGIMNFNVDFIIKHAEELGYKAIYAHSVTNHTFTQKVCSKYNFVTCGLFVGYAPDLSFKKINSVLSQRESTFIEIKSFETSQQAKLYLPEKYKSIITEIYRSLGITIEQQNTDTKQFSQEQQIDEEFVSVLNSVDICIKSASPDTFDTVKKITKQYCINKTDNLYVFMNLEDSSTAELVSELEKTGYFFCGVFPYYYFRHTIVLQYINNTKYDYSKINSYSELAGKIKEIITANDPNQHS